MKTKWFRRRCGASTRSRRQGSARVGNLGEVWAVTWFSSSSGGKVITISGLIGWLEPSNLRSKGRDEMFSPPSKTLGQFKMASSIGRGLPDLKRDVTGVRNETGRAPQRIAGPGAGRATRPGDQCTGLRLPPRSPGNAFFRHPGRKG